ncbi:MAG: hypothetical protein AB7F74_22720 [Parvibaculaceae bacterium]
MRRIILSFAFAGVLLTPAFAVENFIPGGHTYSPDNTPLPPLNSEQDDINLNADLIQSEIYRQQRERKVLDSQFQRFISEQQLEGGDFSPEY